MFGMIEKSTNQNMVLAEAPSKLMPAGPGSKPPPDSKEELRKTKICQKLTPNATIFAGGAQAWSTVIKEEWPRCRVEHVSHKDGQFTKIVRNGSKGSRVAGTQVIDRTWDHMKSHIPRTLSSRRLNVTGTTATLMKHCLLWQWLHEVLAPGYSLWDQLGKLCKEHNHKVGLWRLA